MRHGNNKRKFGREKDQRNALMKSLARSLVLREKINTTEAKAKELRPFVEKLVTLAKKDDLASRRILTARIGGVRETKKLFDTIAPKYKTRAGGYIRIIKLPPRVKDGARMAHIAFV